MLIEASHLGRLHLGGKLDSCGKGKEVRKEADQGLEVRSKVACFLMNPDGLP